MIGNKTENEGGSLAGHLIFVSWHKTSIIRIDAVVAILVKLDGIDRVDDYLKI
jgi:hypothetical protein